MLQIETISYPGNETTFERTVNYWLKKNAHLNIIDIKYSTTFDESDGIVLFSAAIIYRMDPQ